MIVQDFVLDKIGWRVKVFYAVTGYYLYDIMEAMRKIGCRGVHLHDAYRQIFNSELNTGLTYSNPSRRESVMVIACASSADEFANSLQHEQRHLERHIAESLGIDPYSEDASYLAGDISAAMFPYAKKLLCDGCRQKMLKKFGR